MSLFSWHGPQQMALSGHVHAKVKTDKVSFKFNLNLMLWWTWFFPQLHIKGFNEGFFLSWTDLRREKKKNEQGDLIAVPSGCWYS